MNVMNFDNALGIHPKALQLRAKRAEVLANNLANADTPNFKARDFNFREQLINADKAQQGLAMQKTQQGHLSGHVNSKDNLLYRNPFQPAIDGNTVDAQYEKALYARNNTNFNASFEFLNSKFKTLKGALRGDI